MPVFAVALKFTLSAAHTGLYFRNHGKVRPSSASWNGIWLVWSEGKKKWCWQNEWCFYPVQMDQQKVEIFFKITSFFPCLVPYSCWCELCVGRQGGSLRAGNAGHRENFLSTGGWAGTESSVITPLPSVGLRIPRDSCWNNKVKKLMLIKLSFVTLNAAIFKLIPAVFSIHTTQGFSNPP